MVVEAFTLLVLLEKNGCRIKSLQVLSSCMRGRKHTVVTAETIKVEHLSASKYLCANMLKSNFVLIA